MGCRKISAPDCELSDILTSPLIAINKTLNPLHRVSGIRIAPFGIPGFSQVQQWRTPRVMDFICSGSRFFWPQQCFRALRKYCRTVEFFYTDRSRFQYDLADHVAAFQHRLRCTRLS